MPEDEKDKSLFKKVVERQDRLATVRLPYEEVTRDIIDVLRPDLTRWDDISAQAKGKKRNITVYNASPQDAARDSANGMQGSLASRALSWFRYGLSDTDLEKIPEIRQWLQIATREMDIRFKASNFYSCLNRVFKDAITLSNGPMFMEKSQFGDNMVCSTFHPREIFISENSEEVVNVFHREFYLTAVNAAEKFGKEMLSTSLQKTVVGNPQTRIKFIHAVYARDDQILDRETGIPDRPWISIYVEQEATSSDKDNKPARIAGYWSKPFMYWRFEKSSDSVYGWGIGASSLVDIFALNSVTRTNMKAGQIAVDPPMIGPTGAKGLIRTSAGGRSWVDPRHVRDVIPLVQNINYPAGLDREERLDLAIRRYFLVDFFLMLNRAEHAISPEELAEKISEKAVVLGPTIGRLEYDLLEPIHDRGFEMALTEGWIPEPPAILIDSLGESQRIETRYIGQLALAQKRLFEIQQTTQTLARVGPFIEVDSAQLDWLNLDKTTPRVLRDGDWPEDEIRTEDEVTQLRENRQKALDTQLALQTANDAAKASGVAPEPGSPLAAVMGQ